MPTPRKRKPVDATKPAHPDLEAGLQRLSDEGQYLPWRPDLDPQTPIYNEVLSELLAKKVPA